MSVRAVNTVNTSESAEQARQQRSDASVAMWAGIVVAGVLAWIIPTEVWLGIGTLALIGWGVYRLAGGK